MKILYPTAVFLLLTFFHYSFAQQKTEISFLGGVSLPQGDYGSKDRSNDDAIYAMIGGSGGMDVTKYLNSSIGIGLNLAANFNPIDEDEREGHLAFLTGRKFEIDDYFNITLTPYIRFQKKVYKTSMYFQVGYGIGYYKSPRHKLYQSSFLIDYKGKTTLHHQVYAAMGASYQVSPKTQIGIQVQGYHSNPTFDLEVVESSLIDDFRNNYTYEHSPKITTLNPHLVVRLDIGKKTDNQ